jgi:methyl-accepting chemotaxis protein
MRLTDVSLRTKLSGLAFLGLAAVIAILGAAGWAWLRIGRVQGEADRLREVVTALSQARSEERGFLRNQEERLAKRHDELCDAITRDLARLGRADLEQSLTAYRNGFQDLVRALTETTAASDGLDGAVAEILRLAQALNVALAKKQNSLQMEGDELHPDEFNMLTAIRDCVGACYHLRSDFMAYRLSGDEAAIAAMRSTLAKEMQNARNSLEAFSGTKVTQQQWRQAATPILTRLAALSDLPDRAAANRARIEAAIAALDASGNQLETAAQDSVASTKALIATTERTAMLTIAITLAITIVGLLGSTALLVRAIMRPLSEAMHLAHTISTGDFTGRVDVRWRDETGRLSESLNAMADLLRNRIRDVAAQAQEVGGGSASLTEVAQHLQGGASSTSKQAEVVRGLSGEMSQAIQAVAAAAEELRASLAEVERAADAASATAGEGVAAAQGGAEAIAKLGDSSREIGEVVQLISGIAEQTNLLALNATIEAARAGDAGRGFAVVAGEVKDLARQTAAATAQVTAKVQAIQGDGSAAATALQRITEAVQRIDTIQAQVRSAVQAQTATTAEIARSAGQAATGGERIAGEIACVAQGADTTRASADETRAAADRLRLAADRLQGIVAGFRT